MIRFIGGKQGGGKSRYAMGELVKELRSTNRFIVTNLAIEFEPWVDGGKKARKGLIQSLIEKYGEDFDAKERIVMLADEDVHRFFRCRPRRDKETGERVIHWIPGGNDERFRMGEDCEGVAYLIDEAHEFFPAHKWEEVRISALSWGTQARRAGDEVFLLSQVINNVAKPLRGLAQECLWVTNHRHLSLGWFRQLDKISVKSYATSPPSASEEPLYNVTLRDDREWMFGVYNTSKGVGVRGKQADIGQRAKGIHWSWAALFVVGFLVGVYGVVKGIQAGFRKAITPSAAFVGNSIAPAVNTQVNTQAVHAPVIPQKPITIITEVPPPPTRAPEIFVTGLARGARTVVMFSDGTMFEPRRAVDVIGGLLVDDKVFKWAGRTNDAPRSPRPQGAANGR